MARESLGEGRLGPRLKKAFGGSYIANEKFTKATAEQVLAAEETDAIAFGVLFIANPDLPRRFAPMPRSTSPIPKLSTAQGAAGYTDYPFLEASLKSA